MAKKHKCPPCEEGAPGWMVTFSDMTTLILTFFVLLVSMMVMDPKKFVEVLGVFQRTSGDGFDKPTILPAIPNDAYFIQIIRASSRRDNRPDGGELSSQEGESVKVFSHRDNFVVQMADSPFFDRMSIALTENAKQRINYAAERGLKGIANKIKIIGRYSPSELQAFREEGTQPRVSDATLSGGLPRSFERAFLANGIQPTGQLTSQTVWLNDVGDLAMYRARAIQEYLISLGIDRQRIEVIAGEVTGQGVIGPAEGAPGVMLRRGDAETRSPTAGVVVRDAQGNLDNMTMRNIASFIFTEKGSDAGRTAEIIVTGEVVGGGSGFAPPMR